MQDQEESKLIIEESYIRTLLSRNIKRLREDAKMSQLKLSNESGLAHNFINDIENGKKWISPKTLAKLSIALKAEPHLFFISDSRYTEKEAGMFLNDFQNSFDKLIEEYRGRVISGIEEIQDSGTDDKPEDA